MNKIRVSRVVGDSSVLAVYSGTDRIDVCKDGYKITISIQEPDLKPEKAKIFSELLLFSEKVASNYDFYYSKAGK